MVDYFGFSLGFPLSVSSTRLFRYVTKWESLLLVVEVLFLFLFMILLSVQIYTASLLGPQVRRMRPRP